MNAFGTKDTVAVERALVTEASSLIFALERFATEGDGVSICEYLRQFDRHLSFAGLRRVADSVAMRLAASLEGPRW